MENLNYNVDINWNQSHNSIICSPELTRHKGICIEVATSPEFHIGVDGVWSPEHLILGAVNSSLMTTFLALAKNAILDFTSFSCTATGRVEMRRGQLLITDITLNTSVTITNELQRNKAIRVLKKAKNTWTIINSIKSNVTLEIAIQVKPLIIESI